VLFRTSDSHPRRLEPKYRNFGRKTSTADITPLGTSGGGTYDEPPLHHCLRLDHSPRLCVDAGHEPLTLGQPDIHPHAPFIRIADRVPPRAFTWWACRACLQRGGGAVWGASLTRASPAYDQPTSRAL
jgi:hypothetical protein